MGNEQSQEAAEGSQAGSDSNDDFDLSQIEDTRRDRISSPNPAAAASASPQPPPAPDPPREPTPLSVAGASTRISGRRAAKPRANSAKKRRKGGRRVSDVMMDEAEDEAVEEMDEETRLAEEILLREQSQRVRDMEPEMFDEYALSDESQAGDDAQMTGNHQEDDEPTEAVEVADDEGLDFENSESAGLPMSDSEDAKPQDILSIAEPEDDRSEAVAAAETEPEATSTTTISTNVPSVFEEQPEEQMVEETPVPQNRKRKRHTNSASPDTVRDTGSKKKKKRRKETPPTSPDLDMQTDEITKSIEKEKPAQRRQSSMEEFAQPYTDGSKLRHPLFNPDTPEEPRYRHTVEVVIPMSSTGPSIDPRHGVKEAPAPSSGLKRRHKDIASPLAPVHRQDMWDLNTQRDQNGAKSKMRRSTKSTKGKERAVSDDDTSEEYRSQPESDNDKPEPPSKKSKAIGKKRISASISRSSKERSSTPGKGQGMGPYKFKCDVCSKPFASEKSLNKHQKDPAAHDHLLQCTNCSDQFASTAALARHEKETGHGTGNGQQGKTGRFDSHEEAAIKRWRRDFCDEHSLDRYEFNEMMTASGKKGNTAWSYDFITKTEFVQQYYDVLPNRDVRSMRRYRSNFQNVDHSRDWSIEDDADIIHLVSTLGQKWSEIGQRLMRDPEAVRQRWKNKLAYEGKMELGSWSFTENQRFKLAVKEVRRHTLSSSGGLPGDASFNWTAVSIRVKTRTPQQCANHWRATHGKSVKGVWVDSAMSRVVQPRSPSKMEQRLKGAALSEKRVYDSDEDDEEDKHGEEASQDDDDEEEEEEEEEEAEPSRAAENDESALEADEDDAQDEDNLPKRAESPDISSKQTPGRPMTASQAFDQTQAHTSGLKSSSKRKKRSPPSREQPSPGIAVQHRPDPSPEFGRRLRAVLGEDDEAEEEPPAIADEVKAHSSMEDGEETDSDSENGDTRHSALDNDVEATTGSSPEESSKGDSSSESSETSETSETQSPSPSVAQSDAGPHVESQPKQSAGFKAVNANVEPPAAESESTSGHDGADPDVSDEAQDERMKHIFKNASQKSKAREVVNVRRRRHRAWAGDEDDDE